jgi:hypothetical protein
LNKIIPKIKNPVDMSNDRAEERISYLNFNQANRLKHGENKVENVEECESHEQCGKRSNVGGMRKED